MTSQIQDKETNAVEVALITGASGGIGRAIAEALAHPGRLLYLHYGRNQIEAEKTAETCRARGAETRLIHAELSDSAAVQALVPQIVAESGSLDILVNNAGLTRDHLLIQLKDEEYDLVHQVNQKAPFLLMRAAAAVMIRKRKGRIINISSIVGIKGNAGQVNYAATKAALIAMTKSLAREIGSRGITVNAIAPGFIETEMTAGLPDKIKEALLEQILLKRFGRPEDVAHLCAFLAGPEAAYITGQCLSVDGGMNL